MESHEPGNKQDTQKTYTKTKNKIPKGLLKKGIKLLIRFSKLLDIFYGVQSNPIRRSFTKRTCASDSVKFALHSSTTFLGALSM